MQAGTGQGGASGAAALYRGLRSHRALGVMGEINVTPMLDIVFIMLIFFIVTASFVKEPGIDPQRPEAESALKQERGNILVALSGGVMQNALLFTRLCRSLAALSIEVLTHTLTPPNDGSISLGQVAVAAARLRREA